MEADHDNFVFISYSRKDTSRVGWIEDGLSAAGIEFFIDRPTPTDSRWESHLQHKIARCACLLVVWTKDSVESGSVPREVAHAIAQKKRIVPVRLDHVLPPDAFMHLVAADLHRWRGNSEHSEWRKVLHAIKTSGLTTRNPRAKTVTELIRVGSRRELFETVSDLLGQGYRIAATDAEGALLEKTQKITWLAVVYPKFFDRLPKVERIRVTLIESS
jgi:TIR domain